MQAINHCRENLGGMFARKFTPKAGRVVKRSRVTLRGRRQQHRARTGEPFPFVTLQGTSTAKLEGSPRREHNLQGDYIPHPQDRT
jgi:hypothetical protein